MTESAGRKFCKFCLLEWHYSKLWFFHHDWKVFAYTPWLPYKWYFQLIYLVYRWIITFYFFGWLVYSGIDWGSTEYFIFLTNWCFLMFNSYLIIAALSVTTKMISVHLICRPEGEEFSRRYEIKTKAPAGCCGYSDNNISWYQMFQWAFYILGNELAFIVSLIYWILLYDGRRVDGVNANTHLVNGIIALVDIWICGIPIYPLQVIYILIFGVVYSVFTGIYFVASNGKAVYPIIDYGENLGLAVGVVILVALVVNPAIHFIVFYPLSKLKEFILSRLFKGGSEATKSEDVIMEEGEQSL